MKNEMCCEMWNKIKQKEGRKSEKKNIKSHDMNWVSNEKSTAYHNIVSISPKFLSRQSRTEVLVLILQIQYSNGVMTHLSPFTLLNTLHLRSERMVWGD